jgi:hypothetical protein
MRTDYRDIQHGHPGCLKSSAKLRVFRKFFTWYLISEFDALNSQNYKEQNTGCSKTVETRFFLRKNTPWKLLYSETKTRNTKTND